MTPPFQGLTQVCRQLRLEFHDIYMASITLMTHCDALLRTYIAALYAHTRDLLSAPRRNAGRRGNIFIILRFPLQDHFDILPVLKLLMTASQVHCSFEEGNAFVPLRIRPGLAQLNELFKSTAKARKGCWDYILNRVAENMVVDTEDGGLCIDFEVDERTALQVRDWWAITRLPSLSYFTRRFGWRSGCKTLHASEFSG